MSQMIEVKTADLIGPALEWCVALAEGHQPLLMPISHVDYAIGVATVDDNEKVTGFACRYSTDWSQGGPLIEQYAVQLEPWAGYWVAKTDCRLGPDHYAKRDGKTPLIAACRAIVAAKLGDAVSVPAELVGGAA